MGNSGLGAHTHHSILPTGGHGELHNRWLMRHSDNLFLFSKQKDIFMIDLLFRKRNNLFFIKTKHKTFTKIKTKTFYKNKNIYKNKNKNIL